MTDTFKMKDGRNVTVDFTNTKNCLSIKKGDWKQIRNQLNIWLEIACSQMTGSEVFKLINKI